MNLLDALFGLQRQRVLAWLLLHADQAIHVRELARITDTSAGSLHRELARLAEVGLLLRQQRGNQVLYQANRDSPVFGELAGLFRKTSGITSVLRAALAPLGKDITLALVFGSVARGEETMHSDIDVLVIGDASFTAVVTTLYPCQSPLGREVNPVVYTSIDWQSRLAANDGFARDILSRPKQMLLGNLDDLGKPAGDTQTGTANAG